VQASEKVQKWHKINDSKHVVIHCSFFHFSEQIYFVEKQSFRFLTRLEDVVSTSILDNNLTVFDEFMLFIKHSQIII